MSRTLKYILAATFVMAALGLTLASCASTGSDEPSQPASTEIMVSASKGGVAMWQAVATGRAGEGETLVADTIQSVGVFAVNNATGGSNAGEVFTNQQFYNRNAALFVNSPALQSQAADWPDDNDWPYFPTRGWVGGARYLFVGYAPYYDSGVRVVTSDDNEITELVWEGLSSISAADHLLSDLEPYTALSSLNPPKHLDMKHLMARLRFCFQLGDNYAELRTVVVKSMKVDYPESRSMTLNVGYTLNDSGTYDQTLRWQRGEPGTGNSMVQLRNEPGVTSITLERGSPYQALASLYYEPGDPLNQFTIEVTYDVYDSHGTLLRQNDSAVSAISVVRKVEAGYYYDVKIIIEPSYLYVLSDQEPDTDGALIIP